MGLLVGITSIAVNNAPLPVVHQDHSCDSNDEHQTNDVSLNAFDAITSSIQLNLEQSFILIDILPDLEEVQEEFSEIAKSLPSPNKVLKILFRRIISPNAP